MNTIIKTFLICGCSLITYLSSVADISDCDTCQLEEQDVLGKREKQFGMKSECAGLCTDHAHTGSCDPGFGVVILVH